MSAFTISLIVLYGVMLLGAVCIAAIRLRAGYVTVDRTSPWWAKLLYAKVRPHAGTRIIVNVALWVVLLTILSLISVRHSPLGMPAVKDSEPLETKKFIEYADVELWVLQFCAASLVLFFTIVCAAIAKAIGRKLRWLQRAREFILDDFWGIILNFGSMFLVAAFIQAVLVDPRYLWMLLFSSTNIIMYALFSNLGSEERERRAHCRGTCHLAAAASDSTKVEDQ